MERIRYLTVAEANRLKEQVSSNRDRGIVGLMLHTGMRIGETAALQVRDFDVDAQTVRIERTIVKTGSVIDRARGGKLRVKTLTKAVVYKLNKPVGIVLEDGTIKQVLGKDLFTVVGETSEFVKIGTKAHGGEGRTVALTDQQTWRHILAEIEGRDRKAWAWRAGAGTAASLTALGPHRFVGANGQRYSYSGMHDMLVRAMKRAGIPDDKAHPHVLRHTFAVYWLKSGGDLRSLQRMGGWSNITMVARYTEFVTEDLLEVSRRVKFGF